MMRQSMSMSVLAAVAAVFLLGAPPSSAAPNDGGIDAPVNEPCQYCKCAKLFSKRFCSCQPEDAKNPGEFTSRSCEEKGKSYQWCEGDQCGKNASWGDIGLYPV